MNFVLNILPLTGYAVAVFSSRLKLYKNYIRKTILEYFLKLFLCLFLFPHKKLSKMPQEKHVAS